MSETQHYWFQWQKQSQVFQSKYCSHDPDDSEALENTENPLDANKFKDNHRQQMVVNYLYKKQNTTEQQEVNKRFHHLEMEFHNHKPNEVLLCLKKQLEPSLISEILDDVKPGMIRRGKGYIKSKITPSCQKSLKRIQSINWTNPSW